MQQLNPQEALNAIAQDVRAIRKDLHGLCKMLGMVALVAMLLFGCWLLSVIGPGLI